MIKTRREPYDPELFESEAWRQFWWGKTSRTRKATTEYLQKYDTPEDVTQDMMATKYNCTTQAIMLNIQQLKRKGLIENLKHTSRTRLKTRARAVKRYSIFHKFQVPSGSGLKLLAYYYGEEGFLEYLEKFIKNLPEKQILCIKWKFQAVKGGDLIEYMH